MDMTKVLANLPVEAVALFEVLFKKIEQLEETTNRLLKENEDLKRNNEILLEAIKRATKRQYGSSSEATSDLQMQFGLEFEEIEVIDDNAIDDNVEEKSTVRKKRKEKNDSLFDGLDTKITEYSLSEEECKLDDETILVDTGRVKVTTVVEITPAKVETHKKCQRIYENLKTGEEVLAPMDSVPLFEESPLSPSLASYIIAQKFELSLPWYRLANYFKGLGFNVSRQTLSLWQMRVTFEYLKIIFDGMVAAFNKEDTAHGDETTVQVIKEEGRTAHQKSYAWIFRTGEYAYRKIVLFFYSPGRKGAYVREFLKDFKGYLHVDGYAAYETLAGIKLAGCWAHSRRKFVDAAKGFSKNDPRTILANKAIDYINKIFEIERDIRGKTAEERYEERLNRTKPILDEFLAWLKDNYPKTAPKCKLGKAMYYCMNQWDKLATFIEDGRLEVDNNAIERMAKKFAIGRKNWLFSYTAEGAKASAICYSIVETAKANDLIPFEYIKYILEELPHRKANDIEDLMPWSETLPNKCSVKK